MAFDRQILASLPLPGDEHGERVLHVLQAMVTRRILPYFKRKRGTNAIVPARVSEHLAIRRLEDEGSHVEVMSLLAAEGEGRVIQIHERLFDYLAFVIPSDPESRLGDGTPEEGKMLAFAELLLRHQVEHLLYPQQHERDVILGDAEAFVLLIPPEAKGVLEERFGRAVRLREVVIRRERLSQVLRDILRSRPPADSDEPAAVVVAPFYLLKQDGILAERFDPGSSLGPLRIFANNYTVQSVKIKASKGILNRVYGHVAHLRREVLETCPFLGLRDGVHVVDLAFIPEKYRLDTQRAEKLLARCLTRWLQVVEAIVP